MNCRRLYGLFCIALLSTAISNGGTTGKIAGRITDSATGQALIAANVILIERMADGRMLPLSAALQQGAASDLSGEYYIINIPPGMYSVKFSYMGYQSIIVPDVRVSSDLTTRIDRELSSTIIEAGEAVVVTGERREIQKDLTSSQVSIGADQIDEMPVRSVRDLLSLQAGVTLDASGNLHIRGGRSTEITYMVDGVQILDPLNRSSGISIDDQSIDELKTITGTFNAEYGQALSGVVNIVTKQGSDQFKLNLTGYCGDYYSRDADVYYVMDNPEWANAVVRYATGADDNLNYEFPNSEGLPDAGYIAEKSYLTRKSYLSNFNPLQAKDAQLNVSGPVPFTNARLTYYTSGRYNYNPGYIYGARYFMPWGFQSPVSDTLNTFQAVDNRLVAMRSYEGYSTNSKLNYRLTNAINLSYGLYYNHDSGQYGYTHNYKYVPDAQRQYTTDALTHIFSLKHSLSPRTFYDFKVSLYNKDHANYRYKDPEDYRYMPTESSDFELYVFGYENQEDISMWSNSYDFRYWGNPVSYGITDVKFQSYKLDMTSQLTKRHLMKWGGNVTRHELFYDQFEIQFSSNDYRPYVPGDNSPYHVKYKASPREMAAYVQDKIEFEELIINFGVRFDYFDSGGRILTDPKDPQIYDPFKLEHIYKNYSQTTPDSDLVDYSVAEREEFWYANASSKYQVSPRFGLSFPITERGVIHFSYGHFFQNPEFRFLYDNPNFWIEGAGAENLVGNADLNAERTVMYELGLQQQLRQNIYLHITGFYRDIRDWIGTGTPIDTYRGITYYRYENKDHAAVKGITLSGKANFGHLMLNLDYTYMTAQGTSSDPKDAYNDSQADRAPRLTFINLNWDQRHSISAVLNYTVKQWSLTMTGSANSGFPYTPEFARGEVSGSGTFIGLTENSARKPWTSNVDLRISRTINIGTTRVSAFLNIRNLFDRRNANNVYSDTGLADYTMQGITQKDRFLEISNVDDYYNNPNYYSPPRFIQFGLRIGL